MVSVTSQTADKDIALGLSYFPSAPTQTTKRGSTATKGGLQLLQGLGREIFGDAVSVSVPLCCAKVPIRTTTKD